MKITGIKITFIMYIYIYWLCISNDNRFHFNTLRISYTFTYIRILTDSFSRPYINDDTNDCCLKKKYVIGRTRGLRYSVSVR